MRLGGMCRAGLETIGKVLTLSLRSLLGSFGKTDEMRDAFARPHPWCLKSFYTSGKSRTFGSMLGGKIRLSTVLVIGL